MEQIVIMLSYIESLCTVTTLLGVITTICVVLIVVNSFSGK